MTGRNAGEHSVATPVARDKIKWAKSAARSLPRHGAWQHDAELPLPAEKWPQFLIRHVLEKNWWPETESNCRHGDFALSGASCHYLRKVMKIIRFAFPIRASFATDGFSAPHDPARRL